MAQKRSITYEINYQNNQQSLAKTISELERIKTSTRVELGLGGIGDADFAKAKAAADKLSSALSKSFDYDLGVTNVAKFREEIQKTGSSLDSLYADLKKVAPEGTEAFRDMAASIATSNIQLQKTTGFLDKMATTFMNTIRWSIATTALNGITEGLSSAVSFVEKLDTSLNNIRVVTGASADDMDRFAKEANKAAIELGASTRDIAEGALIFYQQGDTDADAMYKAQVTQKLTNVSTDLNAEEASEFMTAIWNGFQVNKRAAQEGMQVYDEYADKLAAVAASTASDVTEQATAMAKVASVANQVGIGFDQLNAIMATTESVTRQAPESIGTAWRTIVSRISDLKLSGVDEEGVTLGDVSGQLSSYGINILDETGELREMGKVIDEIGQKWDTWTVAQQNAVAQLIAGKRQYNYVTALFQEWDSMYQTALDTSETGVGKLQEMQDIYMESNAAIRQQFKTTQEALYSDLFDVDTVNEFYKTLTGIFTVVDNIVKSLGGGMPIFLGLAGLFTQVISGKLAAGLGGVVNNIKSAQLQAQNAKEALQLTQQLRTIDDENTKEIISYIDKFANKQRYMNDDQRALLQTLVQEKVEIQNLDRELNDLSVTASDTYSKLFKEKLSFEGLDAKGTRAAAKSNVDEYVKNAGKALEILNNDFRGKLDSLFEIDNSSAFVDAGEKVQNLYNKIYAGTDSAQVKLAQFRSELINQQDEAEKLSKSLQNLDTQYQSNSNHSDQVAAKTKNLSAQMENAVKIEPWMQAASAAVNFSATLLTVSNSFEVLEDSESSMFAKLQALLGLLGSLGYMLQNIKILGANLETGLDNLFNINLKNNKNINQPSVNQKYQQSDKEVEELIDKRKQKERELISLKTQEKQINTALETVEKARVVASNNLEKSNKKVLSLTQEYNTLLEKKQRKEELENKEKLSAKEKKELIKNNNYANIENQYVQKKLELEEAITEQKQAQLQLDRAETEQVLMQNEAAKNQLNQQSLDLDIKGTEKEISQMSQAMVGASTAGFGMTNMLGGLKNGLAALGAAFQANPIGFIITAITAAITAATFVYDKWIDTLDESAEEWNKQKEALESVKTSYESVKQELENINKQIQELNKLKQERPLSFTEEEELLKLKKQKQELLALTKAREAEYEATKKHTKLATDQMVREFNLDATIQNIDDVFQEVEKKAETLNLNFIGEGVSSLDELTNGEKQVDTIEYLAARNKLTQELNERQKELNQALQSHAITEEIEKINKKIEDTRGALNGVENTLQFQLAHLYNLRAVYDSIGDNSSNYAKQIQIQIDAIEKALNSMTEIQEQIVNQIWTKIDANKRDTLKAVLQEQGQITTQDLQKILPEKLYNTLITQFGEEDLYKAVGSISLRLFEQINNELVTSTEQAKTEWLEIMGDVNPKEWAEKWGLEWDENNPYKKLISTFEDLIKVFDKLSSKTKVVKTAIDEMNKKGELSYNTYKDLITADEEFAKALVFSNGKIELKTTTLQNLLEEQENQIKSQAEIISSEQLQALYTGYTNAELEAKKKTIAELAQTQEYQEAQLGLQQFHALEEKAEYSDLSDGEKRHYNILKENHQKYLEIIYKKPAEQAAKTAEDWLEATYGSRDLQEIANNLSPEKIYEAIKKAFDKSEEGEDDFKASQRKATDFFDEWSHLITDTNKGLTKLNEDLSDLSTKIKNLQEKGRYDEANELIQIAYERVYTFRDKLANAAKQLRSELKNNYTYLQSLFPDLIGNISLENFTMSTTLQDRIKEVLKNNDTAYDELIANTTDEHLKQKLMDAKTDTEERNKIIESLISDILSAFAYVGDEPGEGTWAKQLFSGTDKYLDNLLTSEKDNITKKYKEVIEEIQNEISQINDEASFLESNKYKEKISFDIQVLTNYDKIEEVYRQQHKELEQLAEKGKDVSKELQELDKNERSLQKSIQSTNKDIKDQVKAMRDAANNAEKQVYDDIVKARQAEIDALNEEKDALDDEIDKQKELNDERKEGIEEAKDALNKYKDALQKLWDAEDKHDERRKKLEERAEIAQERATQLTAAASGDLSALANIRDLNKQLQEADEELEQDIIQDIRDKFIEFIDQEIDKLDEQLDALEKQTEILEDMKESIEDKIDALTKQLELDQKNGVIYGRAQSILSNPNQPFTIAGVPYENYSDFLDALAKQDGSYYSIGYQDRKQEILDNLTTYPDYMINQELYGQFLRDGVITPALKEVFGASTENGSQQKNITAVTPVGTVLNSTGSQIINNENINTTTTPVLTYDFSSFMAGFI